MFLYKNLFFFNIFYSFNHNHAYWNQRRLFSSNLPGMFLNLSKILFQFAIVSKICQNFLSFSEFNSHYWPTKFLGLENGLLEQTFQTKIGFAFFYCNVENFFNFAFFQFFLNDLITNNGRELEVVELNPIVEKISIPPSLSVG